MIIYGRLQTLILPFTIAMGKRKYFFEIYIETLNTRPQTGLLALV